MIRWLVEINFDDVDRPGERKQYREFVSDNIAEDSLYVFKYGDDDGEIKSSDELDFYLL